MQGSEHFWSSVPLRDPERETIVEDAQVQPKIRSAEFCDIASASLFGYHVIFVGSAKISSDLLEKRSTNYSDRPRSIMGGELSGWGKMMFMIEVEIRRSLRSTLEQPDGIRAHLRKCEFHFHHIALSHGYITQEGDDPLVELAEVANSQLSKATAASGHFVDFLPFSSAVKYIPLWFPGASFKRRALLLCRPTGNPSRLCDVSAMINIEKMSACEWPVAIPEVGVLGRRFIPSEFALSGIIGSEKEASLVVAHLSHKAAQGA
ncbi:hypothetical protein OG21DRAFT_1524703 [Imleria badia]|nr:hypothetical protein OG21DRAFT_1524703 [Imleria badia]